ncbi:hypothetical protein M407DRAFT_23525 [Tulasnella calospora MUT 4182]|uniref:Protein kinase domain-containing protein n=1 Tax=Tulasnella calospora MUT 4182 TaxID=1051891 RepID=A0A0C3QL14_9AGAM|nr:hypothetical protein M407DRAFT_23525 [Tulasnella calospora MUT 4182]
MAEKTIAASGDVIKTIELATHRASLGSGKFGAATLLATRKPVTGGSEAPVEAAAKELRVNKDITKSIDVASWVDHQKRAWSSYNHENILKFIGYYTKYDFAWVYLFSPYMRNGNAQTYLEKKQSTTEERFLLLRDTLMGLDYLHNLNPPVVHGNLKATNVLISDNGRAVLSDMGLYTLQNCVQLYTVYHSDGLLRQSSPESILTGNRTTNRTTKSDIWAWGCLTLEMMTGKIPYQHLHYEDKIKQQVLSGETPEPHPPPQNWPAGLLELVRKCWSFRPADRPDLRTCVESVNMAVNLIKCFRQEQLQVSGSIFIAGDLLQPGPNQALPDAGNRMTRKVELSPSGALVVVKELNLREVHSISSRAEYFKRFAQQMAVLSSLKHENIIELIGYSATYNFETVSLVTPYMVNSNLADYMDKVADMNGKISLTSFG